MTKGPEPGPDPLEFPLSVRPVTRLGSGPAVLAGRAARPGVLRSFGGVLGGRSPSFAAGRSEAPVLAYLVLRPLVAAPGNEGGTQSTPAGERPPMPDRASDRDADGPAGTGTRVYEILHRIPRDGDASTGAAERVRSWTPPPRTVFRGGMLSVPAAGPARRATDPGSRRSGVDASDRGSDRTTRSTATSTASATSTTSVTTGDGRAPERGLDRAAPVPTGTRSDDMLRSVGRPPTVLVRRAPLDGRNGGPAEAAVSPRLAVGQGAGGASGAVQPVPGPGETATRSRAEPAVGADPGGRRGNGRPSMEVRRTNTTGRAGPSEEHTTGDTGRHGDIGERARPGSPSAGARGRPSGSSSPGTDERSDPRSSVDRLFEDPGSVDRLVDHLHYELDRKRRRERERRGL